MQLTKLVFVFVALVVGEMCCSKIMIIPPDTDGLAQLENSAIQIIKTCYTNYDKIILILGDVSGNFIKKLSSTQFSLLQLDSRRRAENNVNYWSDYPKTERLKRNINRRRKVHIVVTMVKGVWPLSEMIQLFMTSPYWNSKVYFLVLVRLLENTDTDRSRHEIFNSLYIANNNQFLNTTLMCRDRTKGIMLYSLNHFLNRAPEPWRLKESIKVSGYANGLSFFVREYSENDEICNNLYFDKTHDLGGSTIETIEFCPVGLACSGKTEVGRIKNVMQFEAKRQSDLMDNFISYVNATRNYVWVKIEKGEPTGTLKLYKVGLITSPSHLVGNISYGTHSPVYRQSCISLVSQFRGNKSQLHKIVSVIDRYSWVGNCIVFFITLILFKYLLRQQLIIGLMNICRLICNCGITAEPSDVPARIYLGCLLFFVITMQAFLTSNLAALVTDDIPVKQVDTIEDLAELGYTVYVPLVYFHYFEDPAFKDRLIELMHDEHCIDTVKGDSLSACLVWNSYNRVEAVKSKLYVSSNCIINSYFVNILPWRWHMEKTFRTFFQISIGGNILMDLETFVYEVRFREAESEKIPEDPAIMTLGNLSFAFVIYGIGLGCAIITCIAEIMIYRYHHRVRTTRVIVLN